jgi:peptidoglycan biosynthesis protein MviN/MurJ (putative lipid II flippase)
MTIAWSLEATLYSMGVTWRLVLLSLPGLIVNVALSLILLPVVGIEARPIAVTAAMLLYVVLLSHYLSNLKDGFDVAKALPKRKIIEIVALVALVSGFSRLGSNVLEIPSPVWAATALGLAGVIVLVATRSWLRDQSLSQPVGDG